MITRNGKNYPEKLRFTPKTTDRPHLSTTKPPVGHGQIAATAEADRSGGAFRQPPWWLIGPVGILPVYCWFGGKIEQPPRWLIGPVGIFGKSPRWLIGQAAQVRNPGTTVTKFPDKRSKRHGRRLVHCTIAESCCKAQGFRCFSTYFQHLQPVVKTKKNRNSGVRGMRET